MTDLLAQFDPANPLHLAGALGAVALALIALALVAALRAMARANRRSAEATDSLAQLARAVETLDRGQHQLAGGLKLVTEGQAGAQMRLSKTLETRMEEVQRAMGDSLRTSATRTAASLGALQERLETIDKAQGKIEKLSGEVLSLQDILSNKQTRGAFGEIQLNDIVSKALPADSYVFQETLSNGKRADCVIHLPGPPGAIAIDSKFPLEAYERLIGADSDSERKTAARLFRNDVTAHMKAIAEKYVIPGETADSALMFLPSEAVYAELHASFPEVVAQGQTLRVWLVSPTTLMATLNTMRAILKDARLREQADKLRHELSMLHKDVTRLAARVGNLDRHFDMARKDVEEIKLSAEKAGRRSARLEAVEFEEDTPETAPAPLKLAPGE